MNEVLIIITCYAIHERSLIMRDQNNRRRREREKKSLGSPNEIKYLIVDFFLHEIFLDKSN